MFYRLIITLSILVICVFQNVYALCSILNSSNQPAQNTEDALGILLTSKETCPKDVFTLRHILKKYDLKIETTMVANRGFHNPTQGSFSLFEMVSGTLHSSNHTLFIGPGDFFFGHFTKISSEGSLVADQTPGKDSLMIEAFAWDPVKEVYNFYELRGDGKQGQWFYRGDSTDILADNELLHRQLNPEYPQFGNRLRCSACHDAGGPIMKELYHPHNDWWEPKRKLNFGGREPDAALQEILTTLTSADHLAKNVILGIKKLNNSKKLYKNNHSLQEQLRPLFCPQELNFRSDSIPNDQNQSTINIPIEFFIDSRFFPKKMNSIIISRSDYEKALRDLGSYFPETNLQDGDHAWLTPVKAKSDKMHVDNLIKRDLIDKKFMLAVLDVDMTNPVFSQERCRLLRFLPNAITVDWQDIFIQNLAHARDASAKQLLINLTDPNRTTTFYRQKSERFLKQCHDKLRHTINVNKMYQLLSQRRAEIFLSEISANPRGQILEPGFRVIFPENKIPTRKKLKLNLECDVEIL